MSSLEDLLLSEIAKNKWILKVYYSRTTELISIKVDTNHPWVKGTFVYLNEGPCIFQGEIITKLQKN